MPDTIDATTARRQFGEMVKRVANGERVIVELRGTTAMALVPAADLALLQAIEELIERRNLHPTDGEPEDWSGVFPGLRVFGD